MVVAADDASRPVIGYSAAGQLSQGELPCNLRDMLDWHASIIDYARKNGRKASSATKAQWRSAAGDEGQEVLLETAHWNQEGAPFNDLIPKYEGYDCPAGCVALAMAIILRFHQWPEKGTGTLPGYAWYYGEQYIEGHDLGHAYDWSQMPLIYEPGQYTEEQGRQIAQLLYDLAIMSKMDFSPDGSSAYSDVLLRLATYFGYDKQLRYLSRRYITDTDTWENLIRAEIDAARPVFYGGANKSSGGHAFVVDGYKGPYFSLNYGWGKGSSYYLLQPSVDLNPDEVTIFTVSQDMITHIYPDQGGEVYANIVDDSLVPFPWDFRSETFTAGDRSLYDECAAECEVWMNFSLFDRDDRFKAAACEPFLVKSTEAYVPEVTCKIPCAIEEGDCLKLAQQIDNQWVPVQQSTNAFFEFHPGKKISELISLIYSWGDVDSTILNTLPYLYVTGKKSVYWELWSETKGELLATSQLSRSIKKIDGKFYTVTNRWDRETSIIRTVCQFQPGTYRLFIRNFDEEMTVYIKL